MIEIIGSAGSGKSTLCGMLCQAGMGAVAGQEMRLRLPAHMAVFARHLPQLAPMLLGLAREARGPTWDEVKKIVGLSALQTILDRQVRETDGRVVVDQGPIFSLATVYGFGPPGLRHARCQGWWRRAFDRWAAGMEMVVWLDAADDVLWDRIRNRTKRHAVKESSLENAADYFTTYRAAFEHVISQLLSRGPLELLRIDTTTQSLPDVLRQVQRAWDRATEQTGVGHSERLNSPNLDRQGLTATVTRTRHASEGWMSQT